MKHQPGLDSLRAFAIIWLMLYHMSSFGPALPKFIEYGHIGVDLFFVLSGYLIGWQLLKPYTTGNRPQFIHFFARRAFRVLPAYLAVLTLYFTLPSVRESENIQPLWQFLTFTQNIFPDYLRARAFSHAWSLCVEEHFYLILPGLVWLLARKPSPWKIVAVGVATLVGGIALRALIWQQEIAPLIQTGDGSFFIRYVEKIYNPTYTRLDGLLAGVMLAVVKGFRPTWWSWAMERGTGFLVMGMVGVALVLGMKSPGYISAVIGYPLLAISLAAILVAAVSHRTWLGRTTLPGVHYIAAMAFSLYLTHKSVFHLVRLHLGPPLASSPLLEFCVFWGAALAGGAMLYIAVERPGLRLRDQLFLAASSPSLARRSVG